MLIDIPLNELTRICPSTTIAAVTDAAPLLRTVGDRIRIARDRKGWSQAELGDRAKLNKETINRMELGANTSMESIISVAAALELNPSQLLHRSQDQDSSDTEEVTFDIQAGYKRNDIPVIAEGDATPDPDLLWDADGLRADVEDRISRPFDVSDPHAIGIRVRGDSMIPRYKAGDILILSTESDVEDGDAVCVDMKSGERLLKIARRYGNDWILESENRAYGPRPVKKSEIMSMRPVLWVRFARRGNQTKR